MKTKTIFRSLYISAICYFLLACGGGGGGGEVAPPIGDVNGNWAISESFTSQNINCNGFDSYILTAVQSGNSLTVTDDSGNVFSGTLNGNKLSWTGSYPDGAGVSTINSMSVTVSADCNSLSGSSTWTYVEQGWGTCTGTTVVTGAKLSGSGC